MLWRSPLGQLKIHFRYPHFFSIFQGLPKSVSVHCMLSKIHTDIQKETCRCKQLFTLITILKISRRLLEIFAASEFFFQACVILTFLRQMEKTRSSTQSLQRDHRYNFQKYQCFPVILRLGYQCFTYPFQVKFS